MVLSQSPLPLWSGIGYLRLSETGQDPERNGDRALRCFTDAASAWGLVRTRALLTGASESEVASQTKGLGPPGVFTPRRPWLM